MLSSINLSIMVKPTAHFSHRFSSNWFDIAAGPCHQPGGSAIIAYCRNTGSYKGEEAMKMHKPAIRAALFAASALSSIACAQQAVGQTTADQDTVAALQIEPNDPVATTNDIVAIARRCKVPPMPSANRPALPIPSLRRILVNFPTRILPSRSIAFPASRSIVTLMAKV